VRRSAKGGPRRTWLFVAGADPAAHHAAARSGADVIILELEDFTPPELRPKARSLSVKALESWRKAGAVAGVRINPLQHGGLDDLLGVLPALKATAAHIHTQLQAIGARGSTLQFGKLWTAAMIAQRTARRWSCLDRTAPNFSSIHPSASMSTIQLPGSSCGSPVDRGKRRFPRRSFTTAGFI